ncbi:MAG TPA: hypothetical protein VNK49_04700 [Anaerolineales bacterium]|nr:hypothetical protein [Anaerolineales bacterium]
MKSRMLMALTVLALALLACQTLFGGGDAPTQEGIEQAPGGGSAASSDFPMTEDAYNVVEFGDNGILYYTKLPLEEVIAFYRAEYTSRGYTERELLTVIEEGTFSIVFDGDPSGKAVVVQGVDLGDGSRTVSIRLEDL